MNIRFINPFQKYAERKCTTRGRVRGASGVSKGKGGQESTSNVFSGIREVTKKWLVERRKKICIEYKDEIMSDEMGASAR